MWGLSLGYGVRWWRKAAGAIGPGLFAAILTVCTGAFAHSTLALGTVATDPTPPQAGEPFTLSVRLLDLAQVPVEDAWVLAEFRLPGLLEPVTARFKDSGTPGVYEARLELPRRSDYTLLLRDQTYRQQEAQATLSFPVGRAPEAPLEFVFPPTATGTGASTRILLLVGLPLIAAVAVTALVLLRKPGDEEKAGPSRPSQET